MSGKRFNPMDDPVIDSSSEEDDVDSHESSTEEEEEEDNHESSKTPSLKNSKALEKSVSDSESETNSGSEPEKNNHVVVTNLGSGTKDPIKVSKSSVKSVAKRSCSKIDGAAASADAKRVKRVSGEEEKKKKKSGGGEETKKTYFQRVWTEEDEIAVLQGLIDYKKENGVSPYDNTNGFYQLVKKSISFDVSKTQFMEKLRSLRKKYENNVGKTKKGVEPIFVKSHDRKAFDLSKFIWGAKGLALESGMKSNAKSSKLKKVESVKQADGKNCEDEVIAANEGEVSLPDPAEMDKFAKSVLVKSLARFGLDDLAAQQGWSRLAVEDKKRFEEQWKALQLREFEFYSQKSGFIHEVVTKMAETFRSNP